MASWPGKTALATCAGATAAGHLQPPQKAAMARLFQSLKHRHQHQHQHHVQQPLHQHQHHVQQPLPQHQHQHLLPGLLPQLHQL